MRVTGESRAAPIIALVGLPGAGKSSVGRRAARLLGAIFVDLDEWIEQRFGRTIAEIFATAGEAEFRRLEAEATRDLPGDRPLVVAAGGGWVVNPEVDAGDGDAFRLVWLQVSPAEAARRMGAAASARPLIDNDPLVRLEELLAERKGAYARAHIHIGTDGRSPDAVADELIVSLRSILDS